MNRRAVFGQNEWNVADKKAGAIDSQDAKPPLRCEPQVAVSGDLPEGRIAVH